MVRIRPNIQSHFSRLMDEAFQKSKTDFNPEDIPSIRVQVDSGEKALAYLRAGEASAIRLLMRGVDENLAAFPEARGTIFGSRLVILEIFARAFVKNPAGLKVMADEVVEIQVSYMRLENSVLSKKTKGLIDIDEEVDVCRRAFEIYLKILRACARLIDVIEGSSPKDYKLRARVFERVKSFETGRYANLIPPITLTIIRDAVSHESYRKTSSGKALFRSRQGTRRLTKETLRRHSQRLFSQIHVYFDCINLVQPFIVKSSEIEMLARIREYERIRRGVKAEINKAQITMKKEKGLQNTPPSRILSCERKSSSVTRPRKVHAEGKGNGLESGINPR